MVREINGYEYYLTRGLTQNQIDLMEGYFTLTTEDKQVLRDIIPAFAESRGRTSKTVKLRKAQIDPVIMSYINKRFFIGDEPGLGKTVMSAAAYAYYGLMQQQDNKTLGKIIVVTEASHVVKFAKEWQSYGLSVIPLYGGTKKTEKALADFRFEDNDGVVIGWEALRTNGFLDFYLHHHKKFTFGVFDETSKLLNPKSIIYQAADSIINLYQEGLDRVIFLNGTSFEKNIYDFYYQFNILQPKLIPSKKFLDERYVVKEFDSVYRKNSFGKAVKQKFENIVDYKNQNELRDRLKYFFVARKKSDFEDDLPEHEYKLHVIEMTDEQKAVVEKDNRISLINSPKTSNPEAELTIENSPKLKKLLEYYQEVDKDRPIVYVYNKEAQYTIKAELEKLGYKTELLNGDESVDIRAQIIDRFNNYETDALVFNIQKALNIPTSDRIIFYDIPTMPSHTGQIKARIDRNNYTTIKKYDFLCYYLSQEWTNLARLGHFREHHSNEFTGQKDFIYESLVEQMNEYIPSEVSDDISNTFEEMDKNNKEFKDIEGKINKLLGVIGS